jgi:hypothetical protein
MFHFSYRQYLLLGIGVALVLLSVSLNRVAALWDAVVREEALVWHDLKISTGNNAYVSSLDQSTLVVRSASHSNARLTLFTRDDDGSSPGDLVKDLCGRDSCVYTPLDDVRLNGAVADYASGSPLRIVLMHPSGSGIWLEYKGPPSELDTFHNLINAIVIQIRQPTPAEAPG